MLSVNFDDQMGNQLHTGVEYKVVCKVDTAGLGDSIGVELVAFKEMDGESKFYNRWELNEVEKDGNVITFECKAKAKNSGIYRYALRLFPKNADLPHRQDFAYVRWI